MSETINDGGPAFPNTEPNGDTAHEGMTLRDYFAAQAMTLVANDYHLDGSLINNAGLALQCYEIADAMIAARAKGAK
jgi:hypothetical protein